MTRHHMTFNLFNRLVIYLRCLCNGKNSIEFGRSRAEWDKYDRWTQPRKSWDFHMGLERDSNNAVSEFEDVITDVYMKFKWKIYIVCRSWDTTLSYDYVCIISYQPVLWNTTCTHFFQNDLLVQVKNILFQ